MRAVLYHNPRCGTSRRVLELVRARGVEPEIVLYLQNPPDRATLASLAARTGVGVGGLLRAKEPLAKELRLEDADDETLLDAMTANPVLINRPVLITDKGARLCRPAETAREIL